MIEDTFIHELINFPLDRRSPSPSSSSSSSSSDDERDYRKTDRRSVGTASKVSVPPPAPKISMSFNKPTLQPSKGIQIKLATQPKPPPVVVQKTSKINSIFNPDESDEEEEMPPEAKMRMRNVGKDTPTSSGPNSFGKTKQGKKTNSPLKKIIKLIIKLLIRFC